VRAQGSPAERVAKYARSYRARFYRPPADDEAVEARGPGGGAGARRSGGGGGGLAYEDDDDEGLSDGAADPRQPAPRPCPPLISSPCRTSCADDESEGGGGVGEDDDAKYALVSASSDWNHLTAVRGKGGAQLLLRVTAGRKSSLPAPLPPPDPLRRLPRL